MKLEFIFFSNGECFRVDNGSLNLDDAQRKREEEDAAKLYDDPSVFARLIFDREGANAISSVDQRERTDLEKSHADLEHTTLEDLLQAAVLAFQKDRK
jgi:hypothetical protein